MNSEDFLLCTADKFNVVSVLRESTHVFIELQSKQEHCTCPSCGNISSKLHSYYNRTFKDLPMLGNTTTISLKARKFHCLTSNCSRKIFTERFSEHFLPYKRTTVHFEKSVLSIALETGGNVTERISKSVGIPVSDTTCIRRIYKSPLPKTKVPEVLGVDDWAYKKGHRYGTVLVNLQNNNIIDLLPDREASTLENWLKNHTGVKLISRDRYGKYIQGATKGAPQAIQVTDRWHLLKNLKQVVIRIMNREYAKLSQLSTTENQKIKKISILNNETRLLNKSQKRFIEMKKLQEQGLSIRAIARELNMHRQTVKKYMLLEYLPQKCYKRKSNIETHFSYIEKRVNEEPKILLKTLWEELKLRGYTGSYNTLSESLQYFNIKIGRRATGKTNFPKYKKRLFVSPSKTAFLFLIDPEKLRKEQQLKLKELCIKSTDLKITLGLVQNFKRIVKEKSGDKLLKWIEFALNSGIKEVISFAKGVIADYDAIKNAVNLPWSNGPVEGSVNKLKTLKRQMYGRASLELLKRRLVLNNSS